MQLILACGSKNDKSSKNVSSSNVSTGSREAVCKLRLPDSDGVTERTTEYNLREPQVASLPGQLLAITGIDHLPIEIR